MEKRYLVILLLTILSLNVFASTHVNGYYRKNGTYVHPHYRSSPNQTQHDNWSTKGNVNPYTREAGDQTAEY